MAKTATQVQFGGANFIDIAAGATATSDTIVIAGGAQELSFTIKADNQGVPASNDEIVAYLLGTTGDPDGSAANEFATDGHGQRLGVLNTNSEDPAIITVTGLSANLIEAKLHLRRPSGGSANDIRCSAKMLSNDPST